jgi:1-aminocyclopropane-1-carboxylate deaminase
MHPDLINLENTFQASVLTKIDDPLLSEFSIELWMKRDDLLHPIISGNKWRKLKYCLNHALSLNADTLISMGGAYSNHLHALAYTGHLLGLKTQGIIRGEQPTVLTPTLVDMQNWGMKLTFVSRSEYRVLRQYKAPRALPDIKPNEYWLPEGGAQLLALKGVAELVNEIDVSYDILCVPCGTGTTLAGMIDAAPRQTKLLGFAALKNAGFLTTDVNTLLAKPNIHWEINVNYHFGGFAKTTEELIRFMYHFENKTGILLEPVYTGKMMFALYDLIKNNTFKPGQRIVAIHTGGLQGNRRL